jgi:D-2-hydroxyacid dehydrogenase (NADP+)
MIQRARISRVFVQLDRSPGNLPNLLATFPDIRFDIVGLDDPVDVATQADAALLGFVDAAAVVCHGQRLKWVQTAAAGVDHFIQERLIPDGVILTSASGVMADNMAEHIVGLMLSFARCFPQLHEAQRLHTWRGDVGLDTVFELGGQTVVFVGVGAIACATAARLKAFGITTIGVRRSPGEAPEHMDRVVTIDKLDQVLPEAHHVVSSLPHTSHTVDLFDAARFALFREGAYFYNVGRGTSVQHDDLIAALTHGRLAGAGLDVTDPEPLPHDHPLWDAPNVFITGHTAGGTPHYFDRLVDLFAVNLHRYREGAPMVNVVDPSEGY